MKKLYKSEDSKVQHQTAMCSPHHWISQGLFKSISARNDTDSADLALGQSDRVDYLNLLGI